MKNILTLLLLSTMITVQAQSGSIKGKVTNQQLQAIPYATIVLKTTSIGTTTNENGSYTLTNISPGSYSVQFSAIGYKTIYRELNLRSSEEISISVQLSEDLQNLNEVVITSNRRIETLDEVPSSVSVISSRELENLSQTSNSIADILAEVPGLTLSTNQTSSVGQTLRGRNMLILIDGIPQSTPLRSGGRDINTVDPNTLERIEVIKGATAIYGNGSDGGIVNYITKKPKATGKLESTTQINTEGSLVDIDHTVGTKISQTFSGKTNKIGYVASGSFGQSGIYRDANGLVMSPTYGLGETNQYNLFGKINYDLSPNQDIELMYNYYSSNQNTEYTNQPGIYGKEPAIGVIGEVLGVDEGNRHNHNAQLIYNA
ncbi:MAG TPA: TonB-dependent receptor, partial [Flavobacteriaceae bacterium]|nr:TonB-dependent receptor [Flavobacteriaceae bacterium]